MIKKYIDFIKENVGEYIESVSKDDEYLLNIIANYTKDIDPTIRLSNAVNLLSNYDQKSLSKQVEDYLNNDNTIRDDEVSTSVDLTNESVGGKNIFKSFLKVITALGIKESTPDWENINSEFLIYYQYNIDSSKLKFFLDRFKSLSSFSNLIDGNTCSLYYGVKCDQTFEYGFLTKEYKPIGMFKVNKSILNYLMTLESPSSNSLKKELIGLDIKKLTLLCNIKKTMKYFNPGYHEKASNPIIKDGIITFGYHGVGKWDNGKLDITDYDNLKINLKTFLSKFRWCDKVMVSISYNSFWVYLNIKIK
jgi:hypothetical protein